MPTANIEGYRPGLVDLRSGTISREIFVNEAIYAEELERVFARAWLFIGHESQIPNPGDYAVSRMGEESVIQWDGLSLPGSVMDLTEAKSSEHNLRNLYRRWAQFMEADSWDELAGCAGRPRRKRPREIDAAIPLCLIASGAPYMAHCRGQIFGARRRWLRSRCIRQCGVPIARGPAR
jgi:hypothetical protein